MVVPHQQQAVTWLVALAVLAVLALSAAGCSFLGVSASCGRDRYGMPTCPVTSKFIDSQPEAHLVYPGSTAFGNNGGQPEQHLLFSTNPADVHLYVVTAASMPTVYAWYRAWLTSHGWQFASGAPLGPLGVDSQAYDKGTRESFDIQHDSWGAVRWFKVPFPKRIMKLSNETLYSIIFIIEPYKN